MVGVLVVGGKKGLSPIPGERPLPAYVIPDPEHQAPEEVGQQAVGIEVWEGGRNPDEI
jgi:hypothetical protein